MSRFSDLDIDCQNQLKQDRSYLVVMGAITDPPPDLMAESYPTIPAPILSALVRGAVDRLTQLERTQNEILARLRELETTEHD